MGQLTPRKFQSLLLKWFDQHGRKTLPWQKNKTPYRVWVSEIMLQQTQVNTVIPYFQRFMQQFPDLASLAHAHQDQVLHLWAGLGYYSRARHLHAAAKIVLEKWHGCLPDNVSALQQLPGIGQSTAGAIISLAFNQAATILDGNVKRVLARLHGIDQPINEKNTENELWEIATQYTPISRNADYTQAIMDLGATLCTRRQPLCKDCPFTSQCYAYQHDCVEQLPQKKAARTLPKKTATFLILKQGQHVLLYQRPAKGIWGGLFSLPEMPGQPKEKVVRAFCQQQWQLTVTAYQALPALQHTFSHYHLDIFPVLLAVKKGKANLIASAKQIWYNPKAPKALGLPKPVQLIMSSL